MFILLTNSHARNITVIVILLLCINNLNAKRPISITDVSSNSSQIGYAVSTWPVQNVNGEKLDIAVLDSSQRKIFLYEIINQKDKLIATLNVPGSTIITAPRSSGDINGDGYDDILIGLPEEGNGKVYGYLGSENGFSEEPDFEIIAPNYLGKFGVSFDYSFDINNDSINDIVICEPEFEGGAVHFYIGSRDSIPTVSAYSKSISVDEFQFARFVRSVGDINADGYDDLMIGTKSNVDNGEDRFTYFYSGYKNGIYSDADFIIRNSDEVIDLQACGDLNGDGYDDITYNTNLFRYIGYGSLDEFTFERFRLTNDYYDGVRPHANLTQGIGDYNNDGYDDIACIQAAKGFSGDSLNIVVYLGSMEGVDFSRSAGVLARNVDYSIAISVLEDVNNDGYSDFMVRYPTPGDGANPYISIFPGTFDTEAILGTNDWRRCHLNNEFTFYNNSYKADSSVIIIEGVSYDMTNIDSIKHSFGTNGYHELVLTAFDSVGKFHNDTLLIFSQPPLSGGTYTVGHDRIIKSIAQLNDSLECGINGAVNVEVRPGWYTDQLVITYDTIQKGSVTIKASSSADNSPVVEGIKLQNVNNLSVEGIRFSGSTSEFDDEDSIGVVLNSSSIISFKNCQFNIIETRFPLLYSKDSQKINIENSLFSTYGDSLSSNVDDNSHNPSILFENVDSSVIRNNRFYLNAREIGINIGGAGNTIDLNRIEGYFKKVSTPRDYMSYLGIRAKGSANITNNIINGVTIGLDLELIGDEKYNLICNNAIGGNIGGARYTTSYEAGINLLRSSNLDIYHNTVFIDTISHKIDGYIYALRILYSSDLNIKNNIFITAKSDSENDVASVALVDAENFEKDFNVLSQSNLVEYSKRSEQDINSIGVTNQRFDANTLIPTNNLSLFAKTMPALPEVSVDINGVSRDSLLVDPGAYSIDGYTSSYPSPYTNLSLENFVIENPNIGSNRLSVKIKNFRPEDVDSFYVAYSVDSQFISREYISEPIAGYDSVVFTFSTPFNISLLKLHRIKAWLELPSNYQDTRLENNELLYELTLEMNGHYTIMCDTCDFKSLDEANYSLLQCGVTDHVYFDIPSGDYTSQENFTTAPGPVTYSSLSGNREDVMLNMDNINNSNVEIKNVTIYSYTYPWSHGGLNVKDVHDVRFENINFISSNKLSDAIVFVNTSDVQVVNCDFEDYRTAIKFVSYYSYYGFNVIKDCNINNTEYAIKIEGSFHGHSRMEINNNSISNSTYGMYLNGDSKALVNIFNNKISTEEECIINYSYLYFSDIYNNFLKSETSFPIYVNKGSEIRLYNNYLKNESILNTTDGSKSYRYTIKINSSHNINVIANTGFGGVHLHDVRDIKIYNNIFYSNRDVVMNYGFDEVSSSNYNNIFRLDGGDVIHYRLDHFDNVSSLHEFGLETRSISVDPIMDTVNLRATSKRLIRRGLGIYDTLLYYDIEDVARNIAMPDIGAHVIRELVTNKNVTSAQGEIDIVLYPNPSKNYVWFESSVTIIGGSITNQEGLEIMNFTGDNKLDISQLEAGFYVIQFLTAEGKLILKQLMKQD